MMLRQMLLLVTVLAAAALLSPATVRVTAADADSGAFDAVETPSEKGNAGAGREAYEAADAAMRRGDKDVALTKFEEAARHLSGHPMQSEALFQAGLIHRAQERDDDAVAAFHRVVELDPKNTYAYGALGSTHSLRHEHELALEAYANAVAVGNERDPHTADVHCKIGAVRDTTTAIARKRADVSGDAADTAAHAAEVEAAVQAYQQCLDMLDAQKTDKYARAPSKVNDGRAPLRYAVALVGLGRALQTAGRFDEARTVHERGVELDIWVSPHQRFVKPWPFRVPYRRNVVADAEGDDDMMNIGWWTRDEPGFPEKTTQLLEGEFKAIQTEILALVAQEEATADADTAGKFDVEFEGLHDAGRWTHMRFSTDDGAWHAKNCAAAPVTCAILRRVPDVKSCLVAPEQVTADGSGGGCTQLFAQVSRIVPGTHIAPHVGPTNARLRLHLPLQMPKRDGCVALRVGGETRTWTEGRVLAFDDSYEHEVWYHKRHPDETPETLPVGEDSPGCVGDRIVLIVDVWHPLAPSKYTGMPPTEAEKREQERQERQQYEEQQRQQATAAKKKKKKKSKKSKKNKHRDDL